MSSVELSMVIPVRDEIEAVDVLVSRVVEEVEQVGLDGVQRVELQPKEEALVAQGARAITPRSLDDASTR